MTNDEIINRINRREAIQRVTAMLGGLTLIGGSSLITACEKAQERAADTAKAAAAPQQAIGEFSVQDIAYLDEIADTILPTTQASPGAKAAKTGAFMALMVTDTYDPDDQKTFRAGMQTLDEASKKANNGAGFMTATPEQRLTLLTQIDKEAKAHMDARDAAKKAKGKGKTEAEKKAAKVLPDQRKEAAPGADVGAASAITADTPPHYFRQMKELAMLGFFTSEIGCKQALRYVESPGRFDPCVPYQPGEKAWAPHA
jgi:glucoside 3-dehydrogenase (cytochrome c) hitch-hiker subunit